MPGLTNVTRSIMRKLWKKTHSPVEYARRIGVNFGEGLHIYGDVRWSTEPWIITLGRNCHITDGVRFLTHDGGVLLFRDEVPDLELTRPITIGDNVYIGTASMIMGGVTMLVQSLPAIYPAIVWLLERPQGFSRRQMIISERHNANHYIVAT